MKLILLLFVVAVCYQLLIVATAICIAVNGEHGQLFIGHCDYTSRIGGQRIKNAEHYGSKN